MEIAVMPKLFGTFRRVDPLSLYGTTATVIDGPSALH
ncbi:hypothetical protein NQ318_020476 [Aromia moschata]|uniref:Uncharacterized protein n=1 Tax=Aromia moschata TaxID=1265417 RepID=A0AAV8YJ37_9CUCU|nr:hypothetical protein NQ318_020476 [Aromia moschata]